jgi:hypothetical protein
MKFSKLAAVLVVVSLGTSAASGQVRSFVYSASNGGVSQATVNATSRDASRVDTAALAISQQGGSAESTVNAKAMRGARVTAVAEAITGGGQATAVNRSVGRGNANVDTEAVAQSVDGKADAQIVAKGFADRLSKTRILGSSQVLGNGKSQVETLARAHRGGEAEATATGVVQRVDRPGDVLQRVEAMANDGGQTTSRGYALDLD